MGGPSVAFRPGTDQIAESECNNGLIMADAKTGKVVRQSPFTALTGYAIADLSYDPNGQYLATGGYFGGVSVYNANNAALLENLVIPHSSSNGVTTTSVAYSPNSMMLGATLSGGASAVWDIATGSPTVLQGTFDDSSLTFTSDDRFAVTDTGGGVASVFSPKTGKLVRRLHTGSTSLPGLPGYVAASPVGSLLAVAVNSDASSSIEIWNTRTWKEEFVLTVSSAYQFSALSFSSDGTRLAVGDSDGSGAVWSIETRHELVALQERTGAVNKITFSPDGSRVATASEDGIVRIWRTTGPVLDDLSLQGSIESAALSGSRVVVASLDGGRVQISDWRTSGQELGHFMIPSSRTDDIVSLSPGGEYVADVAATPCPSGLTCRSVPIRVFNVETARFLSSYLVPGAEAVTWNQDGSELAIASTTLEIVNLATGIATPLTGGGEQCGEDGPPVFSADDALVAWTTRCGTVGVFSVKGPQVLSFTVPGQPSDLAFNPAATRLAVSTWSGAVTLWNLHTGKSVLSLPTAPSGVNYVAYSRDGRYIVTILVNKTVQVLNAISGHLQRVDQTSAPTTIAPVFSARGGVFATGDAAGAVETWDECPACGDPALLVRLGRGRVVSQLTPLERLAKG